MRKSLKHPYVLALSACLLTLLGTPAMAAPVAGIGSPMPLIQTPQPQMPDQQTQAEPAAKSQTFTGTLAKQGSDYVLQSAGTTYKLSGAENAQSFVGKSVTVIGTLDSTTNTIDVHSIRGASI